MLPKEKQMEVLEAFDLTRSYRSAAELVGVDPHTVARIVAARALGERDPSPVREAVADAFADKIGEWVERSNGKVRADVVHEKLVTMGYTGSERTTRRVVATLKERYRRDNHRIYKPWITEPGGWLQYDFGTGPVVAGVATVLFCAWLAWSRFRAIIPLGDRTWPSVVAALDRTFRLIGNAAPTYLLTDNEKTVTDYHLCGIAVRNEAVVTLSRYYGVTLCTCVPFDPESKGGSESTVKLAKADLVPTDYNLLPDYGTFAELETACETVARSLNERPHTVTREVPATRLEVERAVMHPVPDVPYTAAFGETRSIGWGSTVSFRGARYSVPDRLAGSYAWVRAAGAQVVIVTGTGSGATEVARHPLLPAGQASILDEHYTKRSGDPLNREPRATKPSEEEFLALGEGAKRYVREAAAQGVRRIEHKMAVAVTLASLHGRDAVDRALGIAAMAARFAEGDLESILVHASGEPPVSPVPPAEHSLQAGTGAWSALGADEVRS